MGRFMVERKKKQVEKCELLVSELLTAAFAHLCSDFPCQTPLPSPLCGLYSTESRSVYWVGLYPAVICPLTLKHKHVFLISRCVFRCRKDLFLVVQVFFVLWYFHVLINIMHLSVLCFVSKFEYGTIFRKYIPQKCFLVGWVISFGSTLCCEEVSCI